MKVKHLSILHIFGYNVLKFLAQKPKEKCVDFSKNITFFPKI
jgi:hypothetical protein